MCVGRGSSRRKISACMFIIYRRRELYPYTPHLLTLDSRRPVDRTAVPEQWRHIETPLQPSEWGISYSDTWTGSSKHIC